MTDTATFTTFLKKYNANEENPGFQNKVFQQVQRKYVKSTSQPIIEDIRYSTPIMRVFKIKHNLNDSNQRQSDSTQAPSPLQNTINKIKQSPLVYQKTANVTRKNSQEYSPANSNDLQSTPLHKKYRLISSYINQQKQQEQSLQSSNQQKQNNDDSPLNAYYIQPTMKNDRIPFSRQSTSKSQTQIMGVTQLQRSLYFNTPKSNKQNDSSQKIHLNPIMHSAPRIMEQKSIFTQGKKNYSQTNIEIESSIFKPQNPRAHKTDSPIKFQYRIKKNVSTDNRFSVKRQGVSHLHSSQHSIISPEHIEKIQSNNLAISELIKGNKQILSGLNLD